MSLGKFMGNFILEKFMNYFKNLGVRIFNVTIYCWGIMLIFTTLGNIGVCLYASFVLLGICFPILPEKIRTKLEIKLLYLKWKLMGKI